MAIEKCRGCLSDDRRLYGIGYGEDETGKYIVTSDGERIRVQRVERFIATDRRGNDVYEWDMLWSADAPRDKKLWTAYLHDKEDIEEGWKWLM